MNKLLLILIAFVGLFSFNILAQETLTITTYYPAPFGVYNEIRSRRAAIGDNYFQASVHSWSNTPGVFNVSQISAETDLAVEGSVGIGVLQPGSKLEVLGDVPGVITARSSSGTANIAVGPSGNAANDYSGITLTGDTYFPTTRLQTYSSGYSTPHAFQILHFPNAPISIFTNNTERMRITGSGSVGIATQSPQAQLDVAGGVRIGDDTSACNANKSGTMRYNGGQIQYCDGSNWTSISGSAQAPTRGTYRGRNNYSTYQTIDLGFRPKVVVVFGIFSGFHMDVPGFQTIVLGLEGNDILGAMQIIDNGFRVKGIYLNYPAARTYAYLAW